MFGPDARELMLWAATIATKSTNAPAATIQMEEFERSAGATVGAAAAAAAPPPAMLADAPQL
jgi:hypothetical protein